MTSSIAIGRGARPLTIGRARGFCDASASGTRENVRSAERGIRTAVSRHGRRRCGLLPAWEGLSSFRRSSCTERSMQMEKVGGKGVLVRFIAALVLVYITFNPEGFSYFHWAIDPIVSGGAAAQNAPLKVLAGLLLLGIWIFFVQTTRRSIGWKGALLILAILATVGWALISYRLLSASSGRAIAHIVLIALSLVLTLGMSWSHVSRRISGQVDTDQID